LKRWDSTPSPKFEDSNLSLPTSVVITSGTLSTNSTENFESEPLEYVGQTGKNSLIPYEQCTSIVPYKTVVPDHNEIRTFQSSYDWKEFYAVPILVSAHSYTRLVKSDGKWCMVKGCTKTPEYGNQHGMYPLCSEHYRELKNLEMGELL
jgi:hypothetical protein